MQLLLLFSFLLATTNALALSSARQQQDFANASANEPRVNLDYATYEGTSLPNGINQFLGMRYAAPPTGTRRFRRPDLPLNETGVVPAKEHGPICYGVTNPSVPAVPLPTSEDCLFIDVYAPANTTYQYADGLPGILWLQGGAFVQLFNPNYNGTGLIEAAHQDAIVVSFNYRTGPYGFLASEELAAEKNLNIGLHDQRAAIRWVQRHISNFGGDPNRVTLFGTSVGGGSVLMQLLAYGGNIPAEEVNVRWSAGIAEAVYLPSVYEVDDMTFHYQELLKATNCSDLTCLRAAPTEMLQAANTAVPFPGQKDAPLFGYGPVLDGSLIPDRPLTLLKQGHFLKDKPLIIGTSRTEGTVFAPQVNTTADVNDFLKTQFPNITNSTLTKLNKLYSDTPRTLPGVTKPLSPLFLLAAELYGDASFTCPAVDFATQLSAAGVPVHFFIDNIRDPVEVANGYIVPHTWELQAVWGPQYSTEYVALPGADSYNEGGVNANIVPVVQRYWTSFVRTVGNVNLLRADNAPVWREVGKGEFLKLQTNATRMERIGRELVEKCAFWESVRREIGQ